MGEEKVVKENRLSNGLDDRAVLSYSQAAYQ
jgi:hypothetical protein